MMIAFGVACMLVYAINAWAAADAKPRYADAAGVASLLCMSYGMSNVLVELYGFPDAILSFPIMDAILTFMVWRAWKRNQRTWKMALMGIFVAQLTIHFLGIFAWKIGTMTSAGLYNYAVLINVTFAAQLAVVGSAGIGHALGRAFNHLSRLRSVPFRGGSK